jgi:proteasome lid subunit RPN8/RPN11
LRLSQLALESFIGDVRHHGCLGRETGGFFMTAPGEPDVVAIALAGDHGVDRGYGRFIITMPAIDAAFTYAERRGLQVRAMVHSHPHAAFLSRTDLRYSMRVLGFVNAVIPTFVDPPTEPAHWGWWQYDGNWVPCAPAITGPQNTSTQVIIFDAKGVRELREH